MWIKKVYEKEQVSYDNGSTWYDTGNMRLGRTVASYQTECECEGGENTRWVVVPNEYFCVGTDKYTKEQMQTSEDCGQHWTPTLIYRAGSTLIEADSTDCGYIAPMYRNVSGTPYCSGTSKVVDYVEQVSYDGGNTWQNTGNSGITVVEYHSQDCGYVPSPYSQQYLTIESLEDNNEISFGKKGGRMTLTISASTNDGLTWTEYTLNAGTTIATLQTGQKLLLKGLNERYHDISAVITYGHRISSSKMFNVYGNIMSLVSGDTFESATSVSSYAFAYLFAEGKVISAENLILPATTLDEMCYCGMFHHSSIVVAPELPARTLAKTCYMMMFEDCADLTTAPVILATTLASGCCAYMFNNCSSLTVAPALPATNLATRCYYFMFYRCTGLTTAQSILPATTLAEQCYYYMFRGCTSLTTAPELPATTLVSQCYYYMFTECRNLNYIKCLATDIGTTGCTSNWVYATSSSGTFVKASSMTGWRSGDSGIPTGWTITNA